MDLGERDRGSSLETYHRRSAPRARSDPRQHRSAATPVPRPEQPERLVHAGSTGTAAAAPDPAAGTTARTSAAAGHAPRWIAVPSTPSSRAASPCRVSSAGGAAALHDGCRGPRVGLDAGAGGDGDTGPHRLDRQAGGRVEDVVQLPALAAPLPGPGAGGRQSGPRGQADHGGGVVGLVRARAPASRRPARGRPWRCRRRARPARRSRAAPATTRAHRSARPGLRGRAEVQRDVGRDP